MGYVDQRKHRRHAVYLHGIVSAPSAQSHEAVIVDMSEAGCQIASPVAMQPNYEISLRIEPRQIDPIAIPRAQVRWVKGSICGVQFQDVPDSLSAKLTRLLWSFPPPGEHAP